MKTIASYDHYSERLRKMDIRFIGMLSWYSVPSSAEVDCQVANDAIEKHDAPLKKFKAAKPSDIFKRACHAAERTKIKSGVPGEYINYNIRPVTSADGHIWRAIVEERVDAGDKLIGYTQLAQVAFDKSLSIVKFYETEDMSPMQTLYYDSIVDTINDFMDTKSSLISTTRLRLAIGQAYDSMNALPVRLGGTVYFIENAKVPKLENLASFAQEIDDIDVHITPCIDDELQRDNIQKAFESESLKTAQHILAELTSMEERGEAGIPITTREYKTIRQAYEQHKEGIAEYMSMLNLQSTVASVTMNAVDKKLNSILTSIL